MSQPAGQSAGTPLPYDALQLIRNEGVEFLDVMQRHDLATPVPACPDWTLADLAWHMGEVWQFWATIVDDHITDVEAVRAIVEPPRPTGPALLDWVTAAHTAVYGALVGARPEREVWTWTGASRNVEWVRRRMAQETAMHSWDASQAVRIPDDIDPVVASDGIDEFLSWFAGARRADGAGALDGTVHVHCTDTPGEWLVTTFDDSGAVFTREHAKGDTAVRGRACDLLLWLWRRDSRPVEIVGDVEVAERFRAYSDLS